MTVSGVIINPRAGRGSGKGLALAAALGNTTNVRVAVLEEFAALETELRNCAAGSVTDLFISSGDGTVQAIQTWLAENLAASDLPRLCLLPHGTTNMTAADLGFRRSTIAQQAAFIAAPSASALKERATLRVVNPKDGSPRHGMFLGTGAVCEATRYCQQVFNDNGVKGSYATFATLAGAVAKTLFTTSNPHDPTRFDRPYAITVRGPGGIVSSGTQLLALVTTLDKLVLGTRPFWGGKSGSIRATTFPYPVPGVMRWLLPSISGGETRKPPPGAKSVAADWFTIETPMDFVIDGEFFASRQGEPLRIETGSLFTYVTA